MKVKIPLSGWIVWGGLGLFLTVGAYRVGFAIEVKRKE